MSPGTLFIVPTPIGNLEDITYRAIKVLSQVDLILCEDTRRTKILCSHYKIHTNLRSYYNYIERKRIKEIIPYIQQGHNVALVSDSGTPGISDPGYLIIRECINEHIKVVSLPGATAFVPAVVVSGLPLDKILFLGFVPKKENQIKKYFSEFINLNNVTIVFYESPKRIVKTLEVLCSIFPEDTKCVIVREMTKIYEEIYRGTIREILNQLKEKNVIKGEIVVVLHKPS